jgi:hypothetical protein
LFSKLPELFPLKLAAPEAAFVKPPLLDTLIDPAFDIMLLLLIMFFGS